VFDGATLTSGNPRIIAKVNLPWGVGGSYLASGDLDGDGYAEVVAGRDIADDGTLSPWPSFPAVANQVAIYSGRVLATTSTGTNPSAAAVFSGITDPNWHGGTTVAVGDINADHQPELVVGTGEWGGPRVAVWDNVGLLNEKGRRKMCNDFFARGADDRTGVSLVVADIDSSGSEYRTTPDGYGDVLTGSLRDRNMERLFDGESVVLGRPYDQTPYLDIYTDAQASRFAIKDFDGDSLPDLVVSRRNTARLSLNVDDRYHDFDSLTTCDPLRGMLDGPNTGGVWVA
jgi:hypothetical protein